MKRLLMMIGAAEVAIGAVLPMSAFADVAALTTTISGNDVSVTVPAGVLDDTSVLYIVWDTEDRGTSLADWPAENRIVYSGSPAVSSSAGTYALSKAGVPNGAYMRVIATSDVRLIGGYVHLASGQYVDTGIPDNTAWGVDIKFQPIASTANWLKTIGSISDRFTIGRINAVDTTYYLRWGGSGLTGYTNQGTQICGNNQNPITFSNDTEAHSIRISAQSIFVDGTSHTPYAEISENKHCGETGKTILVGAVWMSSGDNTGVNEACNDYWHYAQILDANGNALVNLVPALRGDTASPEAVFYDTVSGKCFANAGTGTLAYSGSATNTVAVSAASSETLYNDRVATWTGGGDPSDATDPDNWSVTDAGTPLPGAIPTSGTKIAGCTLAADADWSALADASTWVMQAEYADVVKGVYLNTEFCPNSNTRVVMDVTVSNITSGKPYPFRLFGVYTNSYSNGAFCIGNDANGLFWGYNSGGTVRNKDTWIPVGRHTVDYNKGVVKVDGTTVLTKTGTFTLDRPLYLFATNDKGTAQVGNAGPFRFHSCKIYDNGTLVRDYVPVTVGGAAKLYDRKSGTLLEFGRKAGTETVTAGPATGVRFGGGPVEIPGTIDLAGHTLTVGDLSGTGTITDSVGGGELHVAVGAGYGFQNEGVALTGGLRLVKEGAGIFIGAKAAQTYTGGTEVAGGIARSGVGDRPWGAALSLVTIADGATFDWAGAFTQTGSAYNFALAGSGTDGNGALVSTAVQDAFNVSTIADMELLDDALIGGYGGWGFSNVNGSYVAHTLTMNGHTLSISLKGSGTNNTGMFAFRSVTTSGTGTISFVNAMSSRVYPSFFGSASDLSSVTLDLGVGYSINAEVAPTIGTFIDRRSVEGTQIRPTYAITVLDCFQPMTTNLVRTVTLGDATHLSPVLDLSTLDGPFVLPSANYSIGMASGATVQIKLGDRKGVSRTPIITWDGEKPEWLDALKFVKGDSERRYGIVVKGDGIYAVSGLIISVH